MTKFKSNSQGGFTLVELLIVVIILALLAAIVVPQFGASTDDTKAASLDTTLVNMRSAIDLYYQQHGHYPGSVVSTAAGCAATDGTAADVTADAGRIQAFLDQMSLYTNAAGGACSTKDATFKYGPYLKKSTIPTNPVNGLATLVTENSGDLVAFSGDSPAAGGWKYDVTSGKFIANDTNTDPNGNGWDTH